MAALTYFLGFITGIVFLLVEKNNKFVRFHAIQSTILFGVLFVLSMVIGAESILAKTINFASIILWIVLMVKAYKGERYKLPYIGKFAQKQIGK